ncbi:hypothetical protein [Bacteroides sp.]|uniref:hypothetical protein n=1 Tax=Bacteroides sp. TaxID=29523 RepID=UPI00260F3F18|nr:hypothetical protein [Bacteroides sp.]
MANILLFEVNNPKEVSVGDDLTAGTHIDSCCLIIVRFINESIMAQHCQSKYIDNFKISINEIVKEAVAITAHEDEDSTQMVKELRDKINTQHFSYYAYKEFNNAKPVVKILSEGFEISPVNDYHLVDLS